MNINDLTIDDLAHATAVIGATSAKNEAILNQLGVAKGDTVTLDAAATNGIQDVHTFTRQILLSPQFGDWRLGVIFLADLLTVPAQNALLKILEEPPARLKIILFISHEANVLKTILSRCRVYYVGEELTKATYNKLDPLTEFLQAENLAKDENLPQILHDRLSAAYQAWIAAGRPAKERHQLEKLLQLVLSTSGQTNKRLLLEEFVISSL